MKNKVKKYLEWFYVFIKSKSSERKKMRRTMLDGIEKYEFGKKKTGKELVNWLNGGDFKFIGFTPNLEYVKENGSAEDLKALFTHAYGGPTLVYAYKKAPFLVITNPSLRFNGSYLEETNKFSNKGPILGVTD